MQTTSKDYFICFDSFCYGNSSTILLYQMLPSSLALCWCCHSNVFQGEEDAWQGRPELKQRGNTRQGRSVYFAPLWN